MANEDLDQVEKHLQDLSNDKIEQLKSLMFFIQQNKKTFDEVRDLIFSIAEEIDILSDQYNKIVDLNEELINTSEETKLISFNASIEAARAGEAGQGFLVVADEIKNLADKSGKSSGKINEVLVNMKNIQERVNALLSDMNKVIRQINENCDSIEESAFSKEVLNSISPSP